MIIIRFLSCIQLFEKIYYNTIYFINFNITKTTLLMFIKIKNGYTNII